MINDETDEPVVLYDDDSSAGMSFDEIVKSKLNQDPDQNIDKSNLDRADIHSNFIILDLQQANQFYKNFKDYKFWLSLSQKMMTFEKNNGNQPIGNFDQVLNYLRNGIMEIPDSPELLYNYACANERVGRYN